MKNKRLIPLLCSVGILFIFGGCVSTTPLKTRPSAKPVQEKSRPPDKKEIIDTIPEKKAPSDEEELDFSLAFADTEEELSQKEHVTPVQQKKTPGTEKLPVFFVPSDMVRIALQQNKGQAVLYSPGTLTIHGYGNPFKPACRGRISVTGIKKKKSRSRVILGLSSNKKNEVFLPCTLLAKSAQNYIEFGDESYRGSIILAPGKGNTFSVINYCHVEEYLRGVVPLEIGRRSEDDIEAVKAQAIAARTYTYLRIIKREKKTFDLLPTVADQVYGGINAEDPLSDRAILMTKNIILTYRDSLIHAYYHSTCGSMTADIQDVWHKNPQPYLRPINDVDKNGKAYCSISRYYNWQESWSTHKLASLMRIYCKKAFPQTTPFKGNIRGIKVTDRFSCKRVKACMVKTNSGTYTYGGDKIRFLFRRNLSGHPILRSSRFKIVKANSKQIVFEGRGYGHGVGMCQMGALGRARADQSFMEILNAYYTGTTIATVKTQ